MKKFNVEDWDSSSENERYESLKIIEEDKSEATISPKPDMPKQE